jgi:hypothetical protein
MPHRTRAARSAYGLAFSALVSAIELGAFGCAGTSGRAGLTPGEKLSLVGLEVVDETSALVPSEDRGRYLPVRVIPGFPDPALQSDPAGYIIVGVGGRPVQKSAEIAWALEAWQPGETLLLTVRRNPYLAADAGWWEAEVRLRHPGNSRDR